MTIALPIHPVTGLTALGFTRRGPIWPQLGGDGTGDGNTGDAPPAEQGQPADNPTDGNVRGDNNPTGDADKGGEGSNSGEGGDGDKPTGTAGTSAKRGSTADDVKVRQARNEAKAAKQEFADLKAAIGKAFGFVSDEEEADPKKLAAQVQASAQEAREAKSELAVYRSAPKDVDAQALLDSRAFAKTLHGLDPSSDDFDEQVADAINKAVEANPSKFRLTPAAPQPPKPPQRSGGDTGTGSGESGQLTYEQYKALSPAERVKAVKDGRANQILGRK